MSDHLPSGNTQPNGNSTRSNGVGSNEGSACVPLQINGHETLTEISFPVHNPTTGNFLYNCSSASPASAIDACAAAEAAFPAWAQTKPSARRDIFLKAASILENRAPELQQYMIDETGSGTPFAAFNTATSAECLRDASGRIAAALEGSAPICAEEGKRALVLKEPYGVILGIAPWNAPFILGFRAVIYPLAAGNTTILKGSELAPKCCWAIGSVMKEAGLPDGCLNVLVHRAEDAAEVTKVLIENKSVKKINFTGSTAVGRIVAAAAGKALKPVLMELGGKASAIVFEDADVELAAKQCALGAFAHVNATLSIPICLPPQTVLALRMTP